MAELVFGTETTLGLSYVELQGNLLSPNTRVLPIGTLPQTLNLTDFSAFLPQHVDYRKCCQLSLTDKRRLFMTLSVHLCL